MYDSVDKNGVLVNESGVLMKRDDKVGTVKWGRDKVYTEKAITKSDFKEVFYIQPATNLVSIFKDTDCSLLSTISLAVFVINSKKYI